MKNKTKEIKADWKELIESLAIELTNSTFLERKEILDRELKKNFVAKGEVHNCKKDGCVPIEESVEEVNELGIHKYMVAGDVCKYCGKLV